MNNHDVTNKEKHNIELKCKILRHNFAVLRKKITLSDLAQKDRVLDSKLVRIGEVKKSKESSIDALA